MFPVAVLSMADLVVEHYDYRYTTAGLPIIELTIKNPGSQELHADLSVTLRQPIDSAQNEIRYKSAGSVKTLRGVDFMPGKEKQVILRNAPLLKPGDYEADVLLQQLTDSKTHRINFNLSDASYVQAKTIRKENKHASTRSGSITVRDRFAIVLAGLIVVMGVQNLRKAILAKQRKQGNEQP